MTTRERLERKIERRKEWAEANQVKAAVEYNRASEIASRIPMGQPILVGHHSERRARADQNRIWNSTQRSYEASKMAEYHEGKAEGLQRKLDKCIFSDDEDAVEKLEERIAGLERKQAAMVEVNKICRSKKLDQQQKEEKIREIIPEITAERLNELFHPVFSHQGQGFPSYALTNNSANINRLKKRLLSVQRRQEDATEAEQNGGVVIAGGETYIRVVFAEKPERSILRDLKEAGFRWHSGSWSGERAKLPESVKALID